jgi:hypothetical protein
MDDPLDMLRPAASPCRAALRQRLLDRTLRELRWQRRLRRLHSLGVLAASFAAGFLTLAALMPPPPCAPVPSVVWRPVELPIRTAATGVDLEWQALDHPEEAAALYRRAGDDYLRRGAHADALRCYGNALDEGRHGDLEVNSDDSWLLIALKQARKKEMNECARE